MLTTSLRYGDFSIPTKTLQEMNVDNVARLMKWKEDLPPSLQIDEDDTRSRPLPHVLLLQYESSGAAIICPDPRAYFQDD